MIKLTFLGAGSTVFARKIVLGCMRKETLSEIEIALYDIDETRLDESYIILSEINKEMNQKRAVIKKYLGLDVRKEALKNADFVINAIQVGGYEPSTVIDFEIPKKYGVRQTIGDTLGIGGIMRALRTIPVLEEFSRDIEEVCPDTLFMNYTNPMAILTGYMQRYTKVKTIGLCNSGQVCTEKLFKNIGMEEKLEGHTELIAGINHMAWLLKIQDKDGVDLYPEIKKRAAEKNANEKHNDMVRFEYIKNLGYYCTESSEHNAEYSPFFIKSRYPELIDKFNIPLDEYPRRCIKQIADWKNEKNTILNNNKVTDVTSKEYASNIIEAIVENKPYKIGCNVLNNGLISNLPDNACVEVPCLIDGLGVTPCRVGSIPVQLAAMNMTNINVQLLVIEAAVTKRKDKIYQAAMLDPHIAAELSIEDIILMCDEMIEAHGAYMEMYY